MPYKSDAQRRWAHTAKGIAALGGLAKVAEWDSASKGMSLPERKISAPAAKPASPKAKPSSVRRGK